ncbi:hypothetical protein SUGI_1078080 [Cryptomeria japonica]|nr:hypothetical protein SUGI_1078080 [Cryptomeria japonica]
MSKRTTFQVGDVYQAERQRDEISRLTDTLGVARIDIDIGSRTVTVEHDQTVTVTRIENELLRLRLKPSLRRTVDI